MPKTKTIQVGIDQESWDKMLDRLGITQPSGDGELLTEMFTLYGWAIDQKLSGRKIISCTSTNGIELTLDNKMKYLKSVTPRDLESEPNNIIKL